MTTSNATPTQRPKRRRWLKILLAIFVVLILLILLLPTLASTSLGKNFILRQINQRIPGKLSADALSLGWFSPATLQKIQYHDPQNKPVVTVDRIDTGVSVWDALAGSTIDLEKFSVVGGRMPDRPDVVVSVHLVGKADLGKKILNITGDSSIAATDQKSGDATKLDLPAGSVISWGDLANNINAMFTYNLAHLQPLIADQLPSDAILEGSYQMGIHITGALTKDSGLRTIRGLKIDSTKIGEGRIAMEGFDVGKAEIPFNMDHGVATITPTDIPFQTGGRIRVRGKIDFNQNPPAFIIDTPDDPAQPFIKDLDLNHKIAAGKFRFFPLFWGSLDQSGNMGQISGKINVRIDSAYIPLDAAAFKSNGALAGALSVHELVTDAPFFNQIGQIIGPVANIGALVQGKNPFQIRGGNIPDVSFALANGKVTYDHLQLGAPFANLTFSGAVGLDNSLAMNMGVGLPGINLPIPIALKGTTAKPELALTGKLPALPQVQDIGKSLEQAPKALENLFNGKKK